ncbi:hypothetical protein V1512DRAFT_264273 [Lipomyces arxii]|uniref:uncharacterized protein n=1 Tax=Lipomyces arxii TaxID=56418 RepID=UPI0034D01665
MRDYRGSTIEDLDLPPAPTITSDTSLDHALEVAFERSAAFLPVISNLRVSLGYLSVLDLQKAFDEPESFNLQGLDLSTALVRDVIPMFQNQHKFNSITPDTPLEEVEQLFKSGYDFVVVTDWSSKFVLGIATLQDLEAFVKRRPSIN